MAKEITKLLENILNNVEAIGLKADDITATAHVYHDNGYGQLRSGQLRFNLTDILSALEVVNKKLGKINKIIDRLEALEKQFKSKK